MYNKKLRTEGKKGSPKKEGGARESIASAVLTGKNVLRAAVVGVAMYAGAQLGAPDMAEQVAAVRQHVAQSEDGAAIGYAIMDTALQTNARGVTQILANRYNSSPGEAERFGNLGYVIKAIEGGRKVQPGAKELGNVVLGEAQLSQENGTVTIAYNPGSQDTQTYAVKSLETGNGLELVLQKERAGLSMVQPTLGPRQPLAQPGAPGVPTTAGERSAPQNYQEGPPAVEQEPGLNGGDPGAGYDGEHTSVTPTQKAGGQTASYVSATAATTRAAQATSTGTANKPVGSLFHYTN